MPWFKRGPAQAAGSSQREPVSHIHALSPTTGSMVLTILLMQEPPSHVPAYLPAFPDKHTCAPSSHLSLYVSPDAPPASITVFMVLCSAAELTFLQSPAGQSL